MHSPQSTRDELKQLLRDTMVRYPQQQFPKEFQQATLEDWQERVRLVGFGRFEQGVKRARSYSEFFPHISKIDEMIPPPKADDAEAINAELKELQRRKDAGEKFYTLADVFSAANKGLKSFPE